jgi:membrane protein DedA with SNARE-associated domain
MEELGQLVAGLEHFVRHYGVVAVMVILAFEALGAPLPGESLLIFASILAGRGEMSLPALLIFAWAGSVMGDNVGYLIGRKLGRAAVARYGAKIGLTAPRFNAVEGMFTRYGAATVAFARFVNVLRQLNGIVAGTLGMNGGSCCSTRSEPRSGWRRGCWGPFISASTHPTSRVLRVTLGSSAACWPRP